VRWRNDTPVSLAEITEYLHRCEATTNPEVIRLRLQHVHLPKLDEADVVAYTPSEGTIRYLRDPQLEDFLDFLDRRE
jgi:hypothetical protein